MSTTTQTTTNIYKAMPSDAEHLIHFFNKNLVTSFPYFSNKARASYSEVFHPENIKQKIASNREIIYIAKTNTETKGLIFGSPPEGGIGTIIWLMVDAQHQGQGIGLCLLKKSIEIYQSLGTHKIKLTVHDKRALKFYLREGFVIEGHHLNHWWNLDFHSLALMI